MPKCEIRDNFLELAENGTLDSFTNDIVKQIQTHLFHDASFVNQSKEINIEISKPLYQTIKIPTTQRVIILDKFDIGKISQRDPDYVRGFYDPQVGKLFLNSSMWCLKTLVHETLHACSVLSKVNSFNKRYRFFNEGITEFFTGYMLSKEYKQSFSDCWLSDELRQCKMTYPSETRLWMSFCHVIPLSEAIKLYFPTDNIDWKQKFQKFIQTIQQDYGYKKFKNPFTSGAGPISINFLRQCEKNFRSKFTDVYRTRTKYTDFSDIK